MVKIPHFFLIKKDGCKYVDNVGKQFELASISKSFTALAIMILNVQGKLSINDNISEYYPEFKFSYKGKICKVSILQLLQHRAGISKKTLCFQYEGMDDIYEAAKAISSFPLCNIPGDRYEYATGGYVILGAVIERVSGKKYSDFMDEIVFKPLSMSNTTALGRPLQGTKKVLGKIVNKKWKGCLAFAPCGYIVSNIEDMNIWLEAFCNTEQLEDSDIKKAIGIIKNKDYYVKMRDEKVLYGFGWFYDVDNQIYYHDGLNPMYSTYMEFREINCTYGIFAAANAEVNSEKMLEGIEKKINGNVDRIIENEINKKNIGVFIKLIILFILIYILLGIDWKFIGIFIASLLVFIFMKKIKNLTWKEVLMWLSIDQIIEIYIYAVIFVEVVSLILRFIIFK